MARRVYPLTGYTFTPSTNTIVVPSVLRQERVLMITDVTTGNIIYNWADPTNNAASWTITQNTPTVVSNVNSYNTDAAHSTTTIVLKYSCSALSATDVISIMVDEINETTQIEATLLDPVGKQRVSTPESLIDTDFEYGVQPSKWEAITMVQNYPNFFGRATGGNSIDLASIIGDGASPRSTVTVTTNTPHGLNAGDVVSVQETLNNNGEGTFLVFPTSATTFTYVARGVISGSFIEGTLTTVYGGGIFDNANISGGINGNYGQWTAVSDTANNSRITVTTPTPHGIFAGTTVIVPQITGNQLQGTYFIDTMSSPNTFSFLANSQILNPISTLNQPIYTSSQGYIEHRPLDGGVILSTGSNVCGAQAIRQTRRYFRYQAGKGIQFSTGTKFTPTFDVQYMIASSIFSGSTNVTITTVQNHNLQPGASVKIEGVQTVGSYNPYNGVFQVAAVIDVNNFTIAPILTQNLNALDQVPGGINVYVTVVTWKGAATRAGLFNEQDGFYFEYDGQQIYAARRWGTKELFGTVSTTQYSNVVTGTLTSFRKQIVVGERIIIKGQTYLVTQINSDTSLNINPAYRGPSTANTYFRKVQVSKVPQSAWNLDKMDGTGPSGYNFDPSKMQMTYIDYSWYGAGTIRYGFRGSNGKITWCHESSQNNTNVAAYQRSGNMPARYESINEPLNSSRLVAGGTAVLGSTLYATDTTLFVDNALYWPSSGYLKINDGTNVELCQYTSIGAFNPTAQGYPITIIRRVQQPTYYSGALYNLNGSYSLWNYVPDASIPGGSGTAQVSVQTVSQQCAPVMTHWGSSVIMDGRFDNDKNFLFAANMQRYLQVGGSGTVSANIISRSASSGVATLTTSSAHSIQAGYNVTISGVNYYYNISQKQLTNNIATLTTSVAHALQVGNSVTITGVDTVFNGTYTITAITSNSFSYSKTNANVGLTSTSGGIATFVGTPYNGTFLVTSVTTTTIIYSFTSSTLTESTVTLTSQGTATQSFGTTLISRPLLSIRVAPSVDNGVGRNFGVRELANNMQLNLYSLQVLAQGQFLIQGILNPTSLNGVNIPNDWLLNKVGSGSLSQIIYHDGTGTLGNTVTQPTNTIAGGDVVFSLYTDNAGGSGGTAYNTTTFDLTKVRNLGNGYMNGDGSATNPGFPNGPDILTIVATNIGGTAANVSAILTWIEAQA